MMRRFKMCVHVQHSIACVGHLPGQDKAACQSYASITHE
jgi:hypothetical protein